MQFSVRSRDKDVVTVAASGSISRLDIAFDPDPLMELLGDDMHSQRLLLDFEHVDFLDSSGVGWVLEHHRRFRAEGGRLVLFALPPMIRQVLELLKLQKILTLADDQAAAEAMSKEEALR